MLVVQELGQIDFGFWLVYDDLVLVGTRDNVHLLLFLFLFTERSLSHADANLVIADLKKRKIHNMTEDRVISSTVVLKSRHFCALDQTSGPELTKIFGKVLVKFPLNSGIYKHFLPLSTYELSTGIRIRLPIFV